MSDKKDSLAMELDRRLDDLFDEDSLLDDESPELFDSEKSKVEKKADKEKNLEALKINRPGGENLEGLNALLLSMEWEIDDRVMDQYLTEIKRLNLEWEKDSIILKFFRILEVLGAYLKNKKVRAHSDTLRVLQDIQSALGVLMDLGEDLTGTQKKEHLAKAYVKFMDFKKGIESSSASSEAKNAKNQNLADLIRSIIREELERFRQSLS